MEAKGIADDQGGYVEFNFFAGHSLFSSWKQGDAGELRQFEIIGDRRIFSVILN